MPEASQNLYNHYLILVKQRVQGIHFSQCGQAKELKLRKAFGWTSKTFWFCFKLWPGGFDIFFGKTTLIHIEPRKVSFIDFKNRFWGLITLALQIFLTVHCFCHKFAWVWSSVAARGWMEWNQHQFLGVGSKIIGSISFWPHSDYNETGTVRLAECLMMTPQVGRLGFHSVLLFWISFWFFLPPAARNFGGFQVFILVRGCTENETWRSN